MVVMTFSRLVRFLAPLALLFTSQALGQATKLDLTVTQWREDLRFLAQELPNSGGCSR
jgi:hypothetical protein